MIAAVLQFAVDVKKDGLRLEIDPWRVPVVACEFLRQHDLGPNLLLRLDWGGYAIWHLYPRYKVSGDGRNLTVYDAGFVDGMLRAYHGGRFTELAHRLDVDVILSESAGPTYHELLAHDEWVPVHEDRIATVFVRPETAETLAAHRGSRRRGSAGQRPFLLPLRRLATGHPWTRRAPPAYKEPGRKGPCADSRPPCCRSQHSPRCSQPSPSPRRPIPTAGSCASITRISATPLPLCSRFDLWEYNNVEERYLLVMIDPEEYPALEALGFRVEARRRTHRRDQRTAGDRLRPSAPASRATPASARWKRPTPPRSRSWRSTRRWPAGSTSVTAGRRKTAWAAGTCGFCV